MKAEVDETALKSLVADIIHELVHFRLISLAVADNCYLLEQIIVTAIRKNMNMIRAEKL